MNSQPVSPQAWLSHEYFRQLATQPQPCFKLAQKFSIDFLDRADPTETATLLIYSQSLNLEKLYDVQQGVVAQLRARHFRLLRHPIDSDSLAVEMLVEVLDDTQIQQTLETLALQHQLELSLLSNPPKLAEPGLLLMDMDSTVIGVECIDEIAKLAGVGEQVAEVTELAMQGKLDFSQSLTHRVGCLKGTDEAVLKQVRDALPLMPGIERLIRVLKQHGWKVAIASGGFTYFADYLKDRLGLDAAVANELDIVDGHLTGAVSSRIVDANVKAQTLTELAEKWGISETQTLAMGDGANDLVMMEQAALGIAYHAKPVVRQQAQAAIRFSGLDVALWMLSR